MKSSDLHSSGAPGDGPILGAGATRSLGQLLESNFHATSALDREQVGDLRWRAAVVDRGGFGELRVEDQLVEVLLVETKARDELEDLGAV